MTHQLNSLDGHAYDVVIIGGGAHGASAAQRLSSQGYSILLVEKGDFGSGTSSRSSRLLHCGLTYLAPDKEVYGDQARGLKRFFGDMIERIRGVNAARRVMKCRTQLVRTSPERLQPFPFFYPIYEDGDYSGWQVDIAFRLLSLFGSKYAPINYKRIPASEAKNLPFVSHLAGKGKLVSLAQFTEYQYNWAERIVVDSVFDAKRMGAKVANYVTATGFERQSDDSWKVSLCDSHDPEKTAVVSGKMLLNTAGPWVDMVNSTGDADIQRQVAMVKGTNVLMQFPEDCRGHGIEWLNNKAQQFYAIPWGPYHYVGPTSAEYEGKPDDVRPEEDEIEFVLRETNLAFPDFNLDRSDVVYAWAGIIARTYVPGDVRRRVGKIHDMAKQGMPNVVSVTEAPIMVYREMGEKLQKIVQKRLKPSGHPRRVDFSPPEVPDLDNSPLASLKHPETRLAHIRYATEHEQVETLIDLMFRRVRLGWEGDVDMDEVEQIAKAVADVKGWDEERIDRELSAYKAFVTDNFLAANLRADAPKAS